MKEDIGRYTRELRRYEEVVVPAFDTDLGIPLQPQLRSATMLAGNDPSEPLQNDDSCSSSDSLGSSL